MRLWLLLIFITSAPFSFADGANTPIKDGSQSSVMTTCMPIVLFICLFVAGALYLFEAGNKRRSTNEKINHKKTQSP